MYTICRLPLCPLLVCCIPWLLLLLLFRRAPFKWGLSHWQRADAAHRVAQQLNWIEPKLKRVEEEEEGEEAEAKRNQFREVYEANEGERWKCWPYGRQRRADPLDSLAHAIIMIMRRLFFFFLFVFLVETKFIYLLFGSINKKAACLKFKWNNALCGWRK